METLDHGQADQLISAGQPYDCSGSIWPRWGKRAQKPGSPILDPWGERFQVAVQRGEHRKNEQALHFIVWSKGPDKESGTADDVVVPPHQKPPTEVNRREPEVKSFVYLDDGEKFA
jgi:hypothetical protein